MPRRYKVVAVVIAFLVIILLPGFIPSSTVIPLKNGQHARITKAAFWRSMFAEADAKISYDNDMKGNPDGTLAVWQDPFDGPITVFSSTNQNVLFCLYDFDVGLTLLRIDTSKPFTLPPTNSTLARILFPSSAQIEWATDDDKEEILGDLREMEAGKQKFQSVSVGTRHYNPTVLLYKLEHEHGSLPP